MGDFANRIAGLDIARSLALFGMVIVNYKLSMSAEENGPEWLIIYTGLFEGRASAIFVILAGIGISLMTRKARYTMDSGTITRLRRTIWKRSFFLFVLGLGLFLLGWDADILHYYAFYMFIASFFIVVSSKKLLGSAVFILLTSQVFQIIFDYTRGWDSTFYFYEDFWTVEGFLRNLLFNGYHPIFPWVCFFLFGMWLGRLNFKDKKLRDTMLIISFLLSIAIEVSSFVLIHLTSELVGIEIAQYFFSTKPMPPNVLYMLASSSTALVVILLCIYLSDIFRNHIMTIALISTGQLALTHYVGHFIVLVFLDMFGLLNNQTLLFATTSSLLFFVTAMIFSYFWRKVYERGPIELMMRKISG
ncbi:DUF418 domain-containing protein [Exiguobacterium qingdaonense]|uniref:DUF418 domain-containing protein n=1 Tax=Exiguobacterium qingdaonense TaxID=2751251 RepID=UPI001BEAC736